MHQQDEESDSEQDIPDGASERNTSEEDKNIGFHN